MKILVVEDDKDLARQISAVLEQKSFLVEVVHDGVSALSLLESFGYDILVLDVQLPGKSGFELCTIYRSRGGNAPVLFLTEMSDIDSKETGFRAGADDYLTKPFHSRELALRIDALCRRMGGYTGRSLQCRHIKLLIDEHVVLKNETQIELLPLEFSLLEYLMRHPNQVFSAQTLLDRVWRSESDASPATVKTYIKTLRKKIDQAGEESIIKNVYGVGYKLQA